MSTVLQRFGFRWLARVETVAVADCVHFAGFRYGRNEINPYENYVTALVQGEAVDSARARFTEFLQHYRPRHLGEALGVELERTYPLWCYPWSRRLPAPGWRDDPADVPDIITFFSARGILRSRIVEEFRWLEQCLDSIRKNGYQPGRFSGDPKTRRLVAADGQVRHVVHDGNHRLAVLAALGVRRLPVRYVPLMTVHEPDLPGWPGVVAKSFTTDDARRIFRAYFAERPVARTTAQPADVLES